MIPISSHPQINTPGSELLLGGIFKTQPWNNKHFPDGNATARSNVELQGQNGNSDFIPNALLL